MGVSWLYEIYGPYALRVGVFLRLFGRTYAISVRRALYIHRMH
jgi:hypothetical protein